MNEVKTSRRVVLEMVDEFIDAINALQEQMTEEPAGDYAP
jgi:hypothetical protein